MNIAIRTHSYSELGLPRSAFALPTRQPQHSAKMTTPIDFGNCSQAVPHERRFNPRARPKKSPGPGSYDIINTRTDVTTKYKTTPTYKMGSSTAPRFNKKAHDTISPGPGVYALNPSVGDQTLSTKRSAG